MSRQNDEFGWLARQYGNQELPLQVCPSAAGFYLGTLTPTGEPYSRESVQYWPTREAAEKALKAGRPAWTQKNGPPNAVELRLARSIETGHDACL